MRVGANVQPGQDVVVTCLVEHAEIARAITREAYRAGARHVVVLYSDLHLRRAAIELGPEEELGWSPPYLLDWVRRWRRRETRQSSRSPEIPIPVSLPTSTPRSSDEPSRRSSASPSSRASRAGTSTGRSSPRPTRAGRRRSSGAGRRAALGRRRDAPHGSTSPILSRPGVRTREAPVAGRRPQRARLRRHSVPRSRHRPDDRADPRARWKCATFETAAGSRTFRTCRPRRSSRARTGGAPRARSLDVPARHVRHHGVADLEVRFEGGQDRRGRRARAPRSSASSSRPTTRRRYLGEVALVDGSSPVKRTGLVFCDTLFDENATCHIAFGDGIPESARRRTTDAGRAARARRERLGRPHGLHDRRGRGRRRRARRDGAATPIIRGDVWQLA